MKTFVFWLVISQLAYSTSALAFGGQVLLETNCPVKEPTGMVADGSFLWISDMESRAYVKVRLTDRKVVQTIEAPGFLPSGITIANGILYTADRRRDTIDRRNLEQKTQLSPIPYYERWATGITHDGTALWIVDARQHKIHKIDPVDGTTIKSFPSPADGPTGIDFDGSHLWVADHKTNEIYRVDPTNGQVVSIIPAPGPHPSALAYDDNALWVADYQTGQLQRISLPEETPYIEEKPRHVHVSYTIYYRAEGTGSITRLEVYLAVPKEIPGQHITGELQFDPEPTRFDKDKWGQTVAVFDLGTVTAGETKQVKWEGDFTLYQVRFHLDPLRLGRVQIPPHLRPYLADDKKYDLQSPVITEIVEALNKEALKKEATGYYSKARSIYNHLTKVISYERSGGWNNAAAVLERGTGSCSEYTFALVALLRRAGIPARYVGAVSERGDEGSFDDVFHRWAEAFFPGYGWVPIDANAGFGAKPGQQGSYFGGRSNRHVVTTLGGGASEYLDWTYNHHETYQVEGIAALASQAIARYRPLESPKNDVPPHQAHKILAPVLTAPHQPSVDNPGPESEASAENFLSRFEQSPWNAAAALIFVLFLGILLGRSMRRK